MLRESGAAEILQALNKNALQGRGRFEEYDTGVIFKWGQAYTLRHIWVHVEGDNSVSACVRTCAAAAPFPPATASFTRFTAETWRIPGAVLREVDRNYKHPVAEASED